MRSRVAEDPAVIAALEAKAARNPRAYRFWLVLIAIAGDIALTVTLVFPVTAFILFGVVLYPETFWLGVAGIVLFAWLLRPGVRFQGRELTEPAPRLHEALVELQAKLRVPGRTRVYLDESFNAGALETGGVLGIAATRALILGVPFLAALSREQLLAMIAHEFGHFSRRHGVLGQWVYRARVGWIEYARQVSNSDSLFDRAAAWYVREFMPYFSTRTFVESRQCEYEADADAMRAVGARSFAEAMTRIAVVGRYWAKNLPPQVRAWQAESPEPPADFLERFARGIGACTRVQAQLWIDEQMREASSWFDTHPSLAARLGAAKQEPLLVTPTASAGEVLLGEAWPKIAGEFNEKWRRDMRPGWLAQHLRLKHVTAPCLQAAEKGLAHALAMREVDRAAGLAHLCELHAAEPEQKHVRFAYGAALLDEDDAEGVGLLHTLAREEPAFRPQAFQRVLSYYERKGDRGQVRRWTAFLEQLAPLVGAARSAFVKEAEKGKGRVTSLAAGVRAVLAEAARLDSCIAGAWLLEGEAKLTYAQRREPLPVTAQLLALAIEPENARRLGQDDDAIARRYEKLLLTLVPADQMIVVRTYFTTEGRPELYPPNCELALFTTDEARLKASVGVEKCDWQ